MPPIDPPPDFSTPSPYYGDDWGGVKSQKRRKPPRQPKTKQQMQAQWLAFGLVTLAILMAITLLPRESAGVVFWGAMSLLVGGAVGIKGIQNLPNIRAMLRRDMRRLRTSYRENHAQVGFWLALLAVGLMVLAGNRFSPGADNSRLEAGLIYLALGIAAVGVIPRSIAQEWREIRAHLRDQSNWILFGLGVLILWVVAEANGQIIGLGLVDDLSHDDQFVYWCVGLVLVIAGLGGVQWLKSIRLKRDMAWEWVTVIIILLLGFAIRLWELENAVHKFIDELNFGSVVLYFEGDDNIKLLHPSIRGFPALYAYWQHWGVGAYGRDLFTLRIVSVVIGTLTLPAVYWLGRELFDKYTGLIAAALLAAFPPHIQYSRLGLNNIADPLFGVLALAAMSHAVKSQKRRDYAISGVCLGLTHYFYEGGKLLYTPLMVTWIILGLVLWRQRPSLQGLGIALLAFVVVAAPIYYTLEGIHAPLTPRMDEVRRATDQERTVDEAPSRDLFIARLKTAFRVYTHQPEEPNFYFGGEHALVLGTLIPLGLLGLAHTIWRVGSPAFVLVIWLVSTSVGNSFLNAPAISARYVVVFPALALLIAVGIRETGTRIWPKKLPAYSQGIVVAGLVTALCIYQVDFFMGPQLTYFNQQVRNKQKDGEDALFRARKLPLGTHIYIIGDDIIDYGYAQGIMIYLRPGMTVEILAPDQLTWLYLEAMTKLENAAFFVIPEDTRTIDRIRRFFILLPPEKSPYNVPEDKQFLMYYAPTYLQQRPYPPVLGIEPQP